MNKFDIVATYKDTGKVVSVSGRMIFFSPDGRYVKLIDYDKPDINAVLYFEAFSSIEISQNGKVVWLWNGKEVEHFE